MIVCILKCIPSSQVTITMILIGVQLIYSGVWLLVEPAGTRTYHPEHKRDIYILACKRKDESFLLSLVYIIMVGNYGVNVRLMNFLNVAENTSFENILLY